MNCMLGDEWRSSGGEATAACRSIHASVDVFPSESEDGSL